MLSLSVHDIQALLAAVLNIVWGKKKKMADRQMDPTSMDIIYKYPFYSCG
jgi:hypothetical protein